MLSLLGSRVGLLRIEVGQSSKLKHSKKSVHWVSLLCNIDSHVQSYRGTSSLTGVSVAPFGDVYSWFHGHSLFIVATEKR